MSYKAHQKEKESVERGKKLLGKEAEFERGSLVGRKGVRGASEA